MKITNNYDLPPAIFNAITRRTYSKGGADFSASGLHTPPQVVRLLKKHGNDLEEDAADSLAALYGSIVHSILEQADEGDDSIREKRLFMEVDGKTISGKFDTFLLAKGRLSDYKFTSVWAGKFGPRAEYVGQQNVYAAILRANGFIVKSAELIYIYRDWSKSKARHDRNHPDSPVEIREVELWSSERVIEHIRERMSLHMDDSVECSAEDRWQRPDEWAVMKPGNKRASKVEKSEAAAQVWAQENIGPLKAYDIEHRPGENTRCELYCAVASVCKQWARIQADKGEMF